MRRWVVPILAGLALAASARAQGPRPIMVNRLPTSLAGEWLFRLGHDPAWASPFREHRNWQEIHVPGNWDKQGFAGYHGHAWYRVSFFISSRLSHEELGLDLGLIGDVDEVFLNGWPVGRTGSFPPAYDKATLVHRFYRLPHEAVRFGEYNELAVHVYNDSSAGGLLGPTPVIDTYDAILGHRFLRDLFAYCLATLLVTLALLHVVLLISQRDCPEHAFFAAFLVCLAVFFLTYTTWGPAQLLGDSGDFRLDVVAFLGAVALFPPPFFRFARRPLPVGLVALETLLALGAAFAIVWREEGDLYLWIRLAEASAAIVSLVVLQTLVHLVKRHHPWGLRLLLASSLFVLAAAADILVDLGVLPRLDVVVGGLFTPLAAVPFALVFSLALASSWVERSWGEPLDHFSGLMARDRFVDRLGAEIERSRRAQAPLAVALLRLGGPRDDTGSEHFASRAVPAMRRALRQIDLLARYDRDTFALLLADTEERVAMTILERLRRAVAENPGPGQTRAPTTAGVAQFRPTRHVTAEELLEEAEAALYAAISEGGDCTATAP